MITSDQLKEAKDRADALHRYLDIDAKKIQLEEEQLSNYLKISSPFPAFRKSDLRKIPQDLGKFF